MKRVKIVVLDGYTLNPGDLSWDALRKMGECVIYERTPSDKTIARAKGAELLLTNKTVLSSRELKELPDCRYIGVLATGYNVVDTEYARERKIPVCNVPAYGAESVAQMTIAHILNITQRVAYHAETVKKGHWQNNPDFCYWDYPLIELNGMTLGIIGLGRIGRTVARIAAQMGMRIIAHDVSPGTAMEEVKMDSLDNVFRQADIITLHCPLTSENVKMIDERSISLMKKNVILINTSRGPLIDEIALAKSLNEERIAGAGLDVLSQEPPSGENPLLKAKNCYITPHIAWATRAARQRLLDTAIENVAAFLSGNPRNVVNGL